MLDKKYNHNEVEENKYNTWMTKGYFKCDPNSDKNHIASFCHHQMLLEDYI